MKMFPRSTYNLILKVLLCGGGEVPVTAHSHVSCLHLCPFPPSYAAQRQTIEKPEVALRNKYIYSTLTFKCQELKRWLVLFAPHAYAKCNHGNPWEDLLSSVCFRSCKRRMLHQSLLLCAPESCVCGSKRVPGTTHPPPQWVGKCAPLWEFSQSSDRGFLLVPVFTVMSLFS